MTTFSCYNYNKIKAANAKKRTAMKKISIRKTVPVHANVEVLVVGGGPSGFAAAVRAGRLGADTMLVERFGFTGGMWTAGLVGPYFDGENKGGLNLELKNTLLKKHAWGGLWNICPDTAEMILVLDDKLREAKVRLLLYSLGTQPLMKNNVIEGVIVETKSGPLAIKAKIVIDCTGDGDIAAASGAPFLTGRPKDGLMQPMTMMFKIGGLKDCYKRDDIASWYRELKTKVSEKEISKKLSYAHPCVIRLPRRGEAAVQWIHITKVSGANAEELTRATLEGRRQVRYALDFFKKARNILGDVYLLALPMVIGVRETRRIQGEYVISFEDIKNGTQFKDAVGASRLNVDIHEPEGDAQTLIRGKSYQFPYRALVPLKIDNLLVAGRCISGSYEAHANYRLTGNCVTTGEAAGAAAFLAIKEKKTPRELDGEKVGKLLRKAGIKMDNPKPAYIYKPCN